MILPNYGSVYRGPVWPVHAHTGRCCATHVVGNVLQIAMSFGLIVPHYVVWLRAKPATISWRWGACLLKSKARLAATTHARAQHTHTHARPAAVIIIMNTRSEKKKKENATLLIIISLRCYMYMGIAGIAQLYTIKLPSLVVGLIRLCIRAYVFFLVFFFEKKLHVARCGVFFAVFFFRI